MDRLLGHKSLNLGCKLFIISAKRRKVAEFGDPGTHKVLKNPLWMEEATLDLNFDGGTKVQPTAKLTFGQFYSLCHLRIGINRVNRGFKIQTNKKQKHQAPNRIKKCN